MMNVSKLFVGCACVLGFLPSGSSGLQLSIKMDHLMGWSSWVFAAGANQLMEMTNGTMSDTSSWDSYDTSDSLISSTPEEDPHWLFNLEFVAGILGALTSGWLCHYWKYKSRRNAESAGQRRDAETVEHRQKEQGALGEIVDGNKKNLGALEEIVVGNQKNEVALQEFAAGNALTVDAIQGWIKTNEAANRNALERLANNQQQLIDQFKKLDEDSNANRDSINMDKLVQALAMARQDGNPPLPGASRDPSFSFSLSPSEYNEPVSVPLRNDVSLRDVATYNLPGMLPGTSQLAERPVVSPEASIRQQHAEKMVEQRREASTPKVNPSEFDPSGHTLVI